MGKSLSEMNAHYKKLVTLQANVATADKDVDIRRYIYRVDTGLVYVVGFKRVFGFIQGFVFTKGLVFIWAF